MMNLLSLGLLAVPAMIAVQTTAPTTPDPMVVTDMAAPHSSDHETEQMPDPVNFCYFGGKAYSKGAIYAEQVCSAGRVTQTGTTNRPPSTLSWMPAGKR